MNGLVVELPWLILGGRLVFDALSIPLLVAAALIWGLTGWAATRPQARLARRASFVGPFVVTGAASLLVTVAGDALTFFLAYSVMGLVAYPLVAARRTSRAVRTARWYVAFMLLGEGALLGALLLAAAASSGGVGFPALDGGLMAALVLVGLGVKSGIPGLHGWMPAAYAVTPSAAAAALAGGTISVGILGFVRFGVGSPTSGLLPEVWVGVGALGVVFGVVRGLVRREPERILAYSSVSQMGLALGALGLAARSGAPAPAVSTAMAAFLFHHALAKASLFLGVGAVREGVTVGGRPDHPLVLVMMSLPALALAGLPLTSGAVAKVALADAIATPELDALLFAASAGTTVLMLHFIGTVRDMTRTGRPATRRLQTGPWIASVVTVAGAIWLWPDFRTASAHALQLSAVAHALPPFFAGALTWAIVRRAGWKGTRRTSLAERTARVFTLRLGEWSGRRREVRPRLRHLPADVRRHARHVVGRAERAVELLDTRVGTWTLTGTLFVMLLIALRLAL